MQKLYRYSGKSAEYFRRVREEKRTTLWVVFLLGVWQMKNEVLRLIADESSSGAKRSKAKTITRGQEFGRENSESE